MGYIKAVENYNLRWGIEVLFKECKQHLNLGKCQSNDFDAQIVETTISFMLFCMLSFQKRVGAYETLGCLFREISADLLEETIQQKLWRLFFEILILFIREFDLDYEDLTKFLLKSELFDIMGNFSKEKTRTETEAA